MKKDDKMEAAKKEKRGAKEKGKGKRKGWPPPKKK